MSHDLTSSLCDILKCNVPMWQVTMFIPMKSGSTIFHIQQSYLFFHIYDNVTIHCLAHIFCHLSISFWNYTHMCIYIMLMPMMCSATVTNILHLAAVSLHLHIHTHMCMYVCTYIHILHAYICMHYTHMQFCNRNNRGPKIRFMEITELQSSAFSEIKNFQQFLTFGNSRGPEIWHSGNIAFQK